MSPKRVLILGASLMQVPAIQAAKRMGHVVITADANISAVGRAYADEFWHVDLLDTKALIRQARESHIDAVLTCATDFSYAVSLIAESCALHGITADVARRANFKDAMRRCFSDNGIASPQYEIFHCPVETDGNRAFDSVIIDSVIKDIQKRIHKTIGFPVVLKPVDNMGARGVSLVHTPEELFNAFRLALLHSRSRTVIVEKNLSGPELSVDSFVVDVVLYPIGTADRHIVFSPYFVEMGHTIPSELSIELQHDAWRVLEQASHALGMVTGTCKGDIIFDGKKAHIGECAARLSGGYMSGFTIPYAYGVDPAEYAVTLALHGTLGADMRNTLRAITPSCTVAERALVTLPGMLRRIHMPQQLQHLAATAFPCDTCDMQVSRHQSEDSFASVRTVILTASAGTQYDLPKNNTDKVGSLIATGPTPKDANKAAALALSHIYFEVEMNDAAHAFLYSNAEDDEDRYRAWYCYAASHEKFREACVQNVQLLVKNIAHCQQHNCMTVHIPHGLQRSIERGTWTHLSAFDAFTCAQSYLPIRIVLRKEESINAIVLRAFLRAGWQGLHYTLQLIQTCSTHTLKNLCVRAHS